ncbi:prepilin peptidase [Helicobacter sp.]|uniref:prepilin peptidase n=1 Tax=Helicobacter sp. TaxID=218 RepID=UPI0025BC52BD|nr:prepilin peptidase [Helicobacter sp.]MBR2494895.1 prepilin peptidase [Helicobacter sp.]
MEIFAITLDTIWHNAFTATFSILWCFAGVCIGAAGAWLLIPNTHNSHLQQDAIAHQAPAQLHANFHKSRYFWSVLGALACGIVGGFGESILLPWLFALVILLLSLCVWDIYYYAVPNWQNLALLLIGISKGAIPLISQAPLHPDFSIDLSIIYFESARSVLTDLLLGAGLTSLIHFIGIMLLQKHLLGEGDIVFYASFSALFGFGTALISIFWGCVLASLIMVTGKILRRDTPPLVPLIPCIVSGLGVGIFYGVWL